MPDPTTNDFNLHLQKIEDLFVDPDSNPFENPQLSISGIQTILNELEIMQLDVPLSHGDLPSSGGDQPRPGGAHQRSLAAILRIPGKQPGY